MSAKETSPAATAPSLFRAAEDLRRASTTVGTPGWVEEARSSVRGAILAVEQALGVLAAADGLGEEILDREPRLLHALEELEAALAGALVSLWETSAGQTELSPGHLPELARRLLSLAQRAFDLVQESMNEPAATD